MSEDTINPRFRWVEGPTANESDWSRIHEIIRFRGWMPLNRNTSRVLVVEDESGVMIGFYVFQAIPYTGPAWLHPSVRGTGIAEEMGKRMIEFLLSCDARGWITIAESAHGEKFCREQGMEQITYPVFIKVPDAA